MPKVSVIVPIYKVENFLTQCLDSIVNQTLEDLEIILVDEGDHDRCREIIDMYAESDKRVVALHDKHGGYGNSVNAGIERATGEYISIIESDDFILPKMMETLYEKAVEKDADIIKSSFFYYWDGERPRLAPHMREIGMRLPKDKLFSPKNYPDLFAAHPSVWSCLYKTEWLKNTGIRFLPKGAYLDIRFRFETMMATDRVLWVNKPFYHWRLTNLTSTNAHWNIKAALERWEFIHDYYKDKPELWEVMAPCMIAEEENNLFCDYALKGSTSEQRKKVEEFRKLYTDRSIITSLYVPGGIKDELLRGSIKKMSFIRKTRRLTDMLNRTGRVYRLFIAWVTTIILYGLFKFNWFDQLSLGGLNDILINVTLIIMLLMSVVFLGYAGMLTTLRLLQTAHNIKK